MSKINVIAYITSATIISSSMLLTNHGNNFNETVKRTFCYNKNLCINSTSNVNDTNNLGFTVLDWSAHMKASTNMLYKKNIEKLNEMSELNDNWDDEGARAFDKALIENVKRLLTKLNQYQPNIFPTSESNIQAEFYIQKNYLELVLSKNKCEVYITDGNNLSNDIFKDIDYNEDEIVSIVQNFYNKNNTR